MSRSTIQIDSIWEGTMPSALSGQAGEFMDSIGIDPDMPGTDTSTDIQSSGAIRPISYATFSSSIVNSHPIAILTNPKSTRTYAQLANGKLVRYLSGLTTDTLVATFSPANSQGAFYYNNYFYVTCGTDVSMYGPLDGTAGSANNVWTGAVLGTQTALTNTTYPTTIGGVSYLNHHGVAHIDGKAYFLDYLNGTGMVHMIKTKKGTYEGSVDDGSAYNVLDLPFNYMPMTICSYGNDLVVAASFTTDSTILQGKAALFFFNPADDIPSFYRIVQLPDALCTALIYNNGYLYGLSGDINGGYRLFQYLGGDTIQTLKIIQHGNLPLQNAIGAIANRIVWAADTATPMYSSGLYAYGSKSDLLPRGLHHIVATSFI